MTLHSKPLQGTIGFLGGGQMAEAIFSGLIDAGLCDASQIVVTDIIEQRLDYLSKTYQIQTHLNDASFLGGIEMVKDVDILFLAIKPQQAATLLEKLGAYIDEKKPLVISIMAGITTSSLEQYMQRSPVVRVMPSTPVFVKQGITGICAGKNSNKEHLQTAHTIFSHLGITYTLQESQLDAFTSIASCAPAFAYMFIEALAAAGSSIGISQDMAEEIAAQVLIGAGTMVQNMAQSPAQLKDNVCSPGGSTIVGVESLEQSSFYQDVISAVQASYKKNQELGQSIGK